MSKLKWPAKWDRLEPPTDPLGAAELLTSSRQRLQCMAVCLERTKNSGASGRLKVRVRTFLSSDTAKLGAMSLALGRRGKTPLSQDEVIKAVQAGLKLNAWQFSGETVFVRGEPKGHGDGVRPVYTFGLREYARQLLATAAARVTANLHPNQFTFQGGIPALSAWLEANLGNAKVVLTTDVPSHHLVLSRERLIADGVLPTSVMSSILFEPMAKAKLKPLGSEGVLLTPGHFPSGVLLGSSSLKGSGKADGRGIPPGAALSQIVAETSLRRILLAVEDAAEGVKVASLADNIIILAPTNAAAEASIIALRQAALVEFGADVADGLQTRTESFSPADGVPFLGSMWTWLDGELARSLVPGAGQRFIDRMMSDALNYGLPKSALLASIKGWLTYAGFDSAMLSG